MYTPFESFNGLTDIENVINAINASCCDLPFRVTKKNIVNSDGKKIGESVCKTYSSGKNKPTRDLVRNASCPVNVYIDDQKNKVFEFACAGYDPENISLEINEENNSYVNLVLKSGCEVLTHSENNEETKSEDIEKADNDKKEIRVYEVEGFKVKDLKIPFYVNPEKFEIESATVEFYHGVVRITFMPKKISFNPVYIRK